MLPMGMAMMGKARPRMPSKLPSLKAAMQAGRVAKYRSRCQAASGEELRRHSHHRQMCITESFHSFILFLVLLTLPRLAGGNAKGLRGDSQSTPKARVVHQAAEDCKDAEAQRRRTEDVGSRVRRTAARAAQLAKVSSLPELVRGHASQPLKSACPC